MRNIIIIISIVLIYGCHNYNYFRSNTKVIGSFENYISGRSDSLEISSDTMNYILDLLNTYENNNNPSYYFTRNNKDYENTIDSISMSGVSQGGTIGFYENGCSKSFLALYVIKYVILEKDYSKGIHYLKSYEKDCSNHTSFHLDSVYYSSGIIQNCFIKGEFYTNSNSYYKKVKLKYEKKEIKKVYCSYRKWAKELRRNDVRENIYPLYKVNFKWE